MNFQIDYCKIDFFFFLLLHPIFSSSIPYMKYALSSLQSSLHVQEYFPTGSHHFKEIFKKKKKKKTSESLLTMLSYAF